MEKLQWKVKHPIDFENDVDFLNTILTSVGVIDIDSFLHPTIKHTYDSFLLKNMEKGIKLLHDNLDKKIFIKVDCDVDGYTSAAYIRQFIESLNPDIKIEYRLDFNKRHGLFYEDVASFDDLGLIIVPDASVLVEEAKMIQKEKNVPILIIDHHEIAEEEMLEYATVINCTDGEYPNRDLSGVGVVHKFCLAYCKQYDLDVEHYANKYLDLVSTGLIADSMDLKSLESRYYVLEGLKKFYYYNELLNEMQKAYEEDMKFGRTITSVGWVIGPRINATIRYGKPEEQINLFRAMCGEQEDIEYQPRRRSKNDPKPPIEIHSLQKTMARVCNNVKQRQDTEVRKFMKELDEAIIEQNLDKNSVIIIDGDEILSKKTVTGLVGNKIASKYKRPVLILKSFKKDVFGGSGRSYDKGNVENFKDFLEKSGVFTKLAGHQSAFGIEIKKDKIEELTNYCNKNIDVNSLVTIHEVDYEIDAKKLKERDVKAVANNFEIWGNSVPEPLFAITNLHIPASQIESYGENNGFIRFVYNGITYIKKYCPKTDYSEMTLKDTHTFGKNKKKLVLNLICQFVLNKWEDKITPQVKILYFDSREDKDAQDIITEEPKVTSSSAVKKVTKVEDDDDDFIF